MNRGAPCLLALVVTWFVTAQASAHTLSRSHSTWRLDGRVAHVEVALPPVEIARTDPAATGRDAAAIVADARLAARLGQRVAAGLALGDAGDACAPTAVPRVRADEQRVVVAFDVECTRIPAPRVTCNLLFDAAPSHLHFVRLQTSARREEGVLTAERRSIDFSAPPSASPGGFSSFVRGGLVHVLSGLDHVAFVIALLLLGGRPRSVIGIATAFTVGHSVTLALAATGRVTPSERAVETLIGVSIAFAALACFHAWGGRALRRRVRAANFVLHAALLGVGTLWRHGLPISAVLGSALLTSCHLALAERARGSSPTREMSWLQPASLALAFGLVHGLAFAGAFAESLAGAPLVTALFGFNLGVELAQLAVIFTATVLLGTVARFRGRTAVAALATCAAALILALGIAWSIDRAASPASRTAIAVR